MLNTLKRLMTALINLFLPDPKQPTLQKPENDGSDVQTDLDEVLADPPILNPLLPVMNESRYMWILDPGHGPLTKGKRSPRLPVKNGARFMEYQFNQIIVQGIASKLEERGVAFYVTVEPEERVGNFLKERVDRANALESDLQKIFVSVHSNAGPAPSIDHFTDPSIRGLEAWFYYGSLEGMVIASKFVEELHNLLGWRNRGIKRRQKNQFYVLKETQMPAILTESGFYNNEEEVKLLCDPYYQNKIIEAHVNAIMYFEQNGIDEQV